MNLEWSSTSYTHRIHFLNSSGLFTFRRLNGPLRRPLFSGPVGGLVTGVPLYRRDLVHGMLIRKSCLTDNTCFSQGDG